MSISRARRNTTNTKPISTCITYLISTTNMYAVKLVVRKKEGKYVAGFASQYPLRDGYEDVASFGTWYGSQMDYAPFGQARIRAEQMADQMNEKGF